jgi:hypothetical protein
VNVTQQQVDALPWTSVLSSNVCRMAWTGDGSEHDLGTIWIEYHGKGDEPNRVYAYPDTDRWRYDRILGAESVGSMRNKLLKDVPYEQLLIEETAAEQVDDLVSRVEDLEAKLLQALRRIENLQRAVEALAAQNGRNAARPKV